MRRGNKDQGEEIIVLKRGNCVAFKMFTSIILILKAIIGHFRSVEKLKKQIPIFCKPRGHC